MRRFPAWFWTGLGVRLACTPFLLQWFHPDERQTLEFAHGFAHGRLTPFLESDLHLRNQTVPWLFSWLIRAADGLGLSTPWAWLVLIHSLLAVVSWLGFWALVESFRVEFPKHERLTRILGWSFALFWAGPMLYSRQLLEAVSFPFAAFAWLAYHKRRHFGEGLSLGIAAFTRYPSALWAISGFWLESIRLAREHAPARDWARVISKFGAGLGIMIAFGGVADWFAYGKWMESAPAYWTFNRPGGPVAGIFGNDSLAVYYRWFEFVFTPWLAPVFLGIAFFSLTKRRDLLLFLLPYLAGHLWTPHREPRFMLPVTPFLALAIAEAIASGAFDGIRTRFGIRVWARPLITAHIALNFVWLPMHLWAQTQSAQAALIFGYHELARVRPDFISGEDPLIDALIPPGIPFSQTLTDAPSRLTWVLANKSPWKNCEAVNRSPLPDWPAVVRPSFSRWFRIRPGRLWACNSV